MRTASSNSSAPEQKEYLVCLFLEDFSVGDTFVGWPLHITIVAWFFIEDPAYFTGIAKLRTARLPKSDTVVGEQQRWGHHTVNLVQKTKHLQLLHDSFLSLVKSTGRLLTKEDFYHDRFRPHITHQGRKSALPGVHLPVHHVYVIRKDIHARPKTVIAKLELA